MAKNSNNNSAVSTQQPLLKTGKPTWSGFRWKFKLLAPYLWPRGKLHLQVCIILAFLLQVLVRIVALFTPILFKKIVDNLSQYQRSDNSVEVTATFTPRNETLENQEDQAFQWHWHYILIFVALKALIGSGGYLTAIRNSLWQLSLQYQKACLHIRLFQHILSVSMRWHISRKTGQVIQVMDRGVTGCTTITNVVVSQIGPIIADVIIAIVFFLSAFDVYIGLIVIFTLVIYALVTVLLSEWRTKYRRARNDAENQKASTAVDSILNVETVKLFTGETWEVDRFTEDAQKFQKAEWRMHFTTNMYATARVSVLNSGFLAGCLLSAHYVVTGHFTTGDFVLFASYLTQLFEPLNMLGANYRMLQQGFIDMEHMFDILETEPEIREDPSTTPLTISEGNIQFENVSFSFNEGQQIMEDVSFTVNPGEIQALVGKSGVGKTTISRLLMRLYDIEAGKILIDGQDISKVKINSLREQIGVVPQDSALFNDSVKYNIMYGRPTSTMTDIISVAHTTKIHETISQFPQGYDTVIGEKGLKLSGGERQRIAIARMLLKNPKLVILDEATSALDTGTERNIQSALLPSFQGRTTIIIAHRLSTVVHADNIIVFDKGKIIESGTHNDLLRRRGTYAQMWAWQQEEANKINEPMLLQSLGIPQDATSPTSTIHSMYTSDGEDYSIADLEEHLNIDDPFIQTEQENQLERQRENFTANDPNLTALHDAHQASGEANETDQQRSVNNEVPKDEKDSDDDNLNTSQTCDGISKDALKNDTENGVNNLT